MEACEVAADGLAPGFEEGGAEGGGAVGGGGGGGLGGLGGLGSWGVVGGGGVGGFRGGDGPVFARHADTIYCLVLSFGTSLLRRLITFGRLRPGLPLSASHPLLFPSFQTRLQLELACRILDVFMQSLPQKPTALSTPMSIENPKVENLRIPTCATRRRRSSIRPLLRRRALPFLLLRLPIGLQRTTGRRPRHAHRRPFCKRRQLDHASLVGVLVVRSGAARERNAKVVFGAAKRDAHDRRISGRADKRGR